MPKTKHLRSSPPWPAPHLCTWRRPGGRTFRRHYAVSKTSPVRHAAWKHIIRRPRARGQDFNDGPPRVINSIQRQSSGDGARKASAVSQRCDGYFWWSTEACRDGGGGVYFRLLLHPPHASYTAPIPTYTHTNPPTLPLTLWGVVVVWCCIDDGTHARAPSVARPRRARSGGSPSVLPCWQSGCEQSIMAS
jgi:hypothetical protein